MSVTFTKHERLSLKDHLELDERWLRDRIAEDPSIFGFGDVVLLNKELIQPKAGRLDLLLRDPSSTQRYEVEIQLGRTDETHIIRTLEHWDVERTRYPQYEHTAVIVAEDITSRVLNVISLFNGFIPLVALQVSAIKIGDHLALMFTKVLDQMQLGVVDDEIEVQLLRRERSGRSAVRRRPLPSWTSWLNSSRRSMVSWSPVQQALYRPRTQRETRQLRGLSAAQTVAPAWPGTVAE